MFITFDAPCQPIWVLLHAYFGSMIIASVLKAQVWAGHGRFHQWFTIRSNLKPIRTLRSFYSFVKKPILQFGLSHLKISPLCISDHLQLKVVMSASKDRHDFEVWCEAQPWLKLQNFSTQQSDPNLCLRRTSTWSLVCTNAVLTKLDGVLQLLHSLFKLTSQR